MLRGAAQRRGTLLRREYHITWSVCRRTQAPCGAHVGAHVCPALVGERVWQRDMRARIVVGPLSKRDYEAFLPGGAPAVALERMLTSNN
jgi:predicted component of type VI protein secretion system